MAKDLIDIKTITKFPKPFAEDCTPYKHRNFKSQILNELPPDVHKAFKVIVLGDVSVGKTCLVNRFCHKTFNSNYKPTIGVDFEVEMFNVLGVPFILQIWDTAGQERFKCIAQSYYRGASAILVVFDKSNTSTLIQTESWLKEARNAGNGDDALVFLIGNKRDLLSNTEIARVDVTAKTTALKLNAEYWSLSAKTSENVKEMFFRVAALVFDSARDTEILEKNTVIGSDLVSFKKSVVVENATRCRCNK